MLLVILGSGYITICETDIHTDPLLSGDGVHDHQAQCGRLLRLLYIYVF